MATLKLARPLTAKRVPVMMDKWTYTAFMHKLARASRTDRSRSNTELVAYVADSDEWFWGFRNEWDALTSCE